MYNLLIGIPYHILGVPDLFSEDAEIIPFSSFSGKLREECEGLRVPSYKFKKWYSVSVKVFFDCEGELNACLEQILNYVGFKFFTVFFLGRDVSTGEWRIIDLKFRNLGKETLRHFIRRFHSQLEPSTMLGLQSSGLEKINRIGYSYED